MIKAIFFYLVFGISSMATATSLEGTGNFEAFIVVDDWPEELVKSFLPSGYSLNSPGESAPGTHPVVLEFGTQRDVRSQIGNGFSFPILFKEYKEFVFGIPYVNIGSNSTNVTFITVLYLDQIPPIFAGYLYALNKKWAHIEENENNYYIRSRDLHGSKNIASANSKKLSKIFPSEMLNEITSQTIVGHLKGHTRYSNMDWGLDNATLYGAEITYRLSENYPGIKQQITKTVGPLDSSGRGGFYIKNRWKLTLPRLTPEILSN